MNTNEKVSQKQENQENIKNPENFDNKEEQIDTKEKLNNFSEQTKNNIKQSAVEANNFGEKILKEATASVGSENDLEQGKKQLEPINNEINNLSSQKEKEIDNIVKPDYFNKKLEKINNDPARQYLKEEGFDGNAGIIYEAGYISGKDKNGENIITKQFFDNYDDLKEFIKNNYDNVDNSDKMKDGLPPFKTHYSKEVYDWSSNLSPENSQKLDNDFDKFAEEYLDPRKWDFVKEKINKTDNRTVEELRKSYVQKQGQEKTENFKDYLRQRAINKDYDKPEIINARNKFLADMEEAKKLENEKPESKTSENIDKKTEEPKPDEKNNKNEDEKVVEKVNSPEVVKKEQTLSEEELLNKKEVELVRFRKGNFGKFKNYDDFKNINPEDSEKFTNFINETINHSIKSLDFSRQKNNRQGMTYPDTVATLMTNDFALLQGMVFAKTGKKIESSQIGTMSFSKLAKEYLGIDVEKDVSKDYFKYFSKRG